MIVYLDSSAAVKLYSFEPGSTLTRRVVAQAEKVATCILTYAETRAAFVRKVRMRQLALAELDTVKRDFETDWSGFFRLLVDQETVSRAAELAEQFALRAYDAVHLASADALVRGTNSQVGFACFDKSLNRAAETLGLELVTS